MEQKILSKHQQDFLKVIAEEKGINETFYLSGGTALAAYYIPYRLSEDLDFFSERELEPQFVTSFLKKKQETLKYKEFDFQKSFNRNLFFLRFAKEILKVEFTYFPFTQLEKPKKVEGIKIDSLLDIAVNKVFTISQNPRTRDFMDLYFIQKKEKYDFFDLLKKARLKFDWYIDPINLGAQLMKSQEIKDYPNLLEKVNDKKWQKYYLGIAKKLGEQI